MTSDQRGRRLRAAPEAPRWRRERLLVNLEEIAEIELFILKRMKEFTLGDHASVFKGSGFNFVGIRDWEPGDRMSSIDWAQSSLTNFSPMITREFEQDSNATIVAVADASLSTRCGIDGATDRHGHRARRRGRRAVGDVLPGSCSAWSRSTTASSSSRRRGRESAARTCSTASTCISSRCSAPIEAGRRDVIIGASKARCGRPSLVPVISDFLFPDASASIRELSLLNAVHDVFLLMADVRFAYEVPRVSDGWIEVFDIETGRTRVFSRRELRRLAARVGEWQDEVERLARDADLDVVRVGLDRWEMETALVEFTAERRLRKM